MLSMEEIKSNTPLLNEIDWEMTPEEAVRLYLEWGCNWARSNYVIRSKNDMSHYFVVNTWKEKPVLYLIRRNSEEAEELAEFNLPEPLGKDFLEDVGHHKGVYGINRNIRNWLKGELNYHA